MKTGTTVEYAKKRTRDHIARFTYLYRALYRRGDARGADRPRVRGARQHLPGDRLPRVPIDHPFAISRPARAFARHVAPDWRRVASIGPVLPTSVPPRRSRGSHANSSFVARPAGNPGAGRPARFRRRSTRRVGVPDQHVHDVGPVLQTSAAASVASDPSGNFVVVWHERWPGRQQLRDLRPALRQRGHRPGERVPRQLLHDIHPGAPRRGVGRERQLRRRLEERCPGRKPDRASSASATTAQGDAGSEFRVNSYTTLGQSQPSVAFDASGNFIVVWQSDGQDGDKAGSSASGTTAPGRPQGASSTSTRTRPTTRSIPPSPPTRAATSSSSGRAMPRTGCALGRLRPALRQRGCTPGRRVPRQLLHDGLAQDARRWLGRERATSSSSGAAPAATVVVTPDLRPALRQPGWPQGARVPHQHVHFGFQENPSVALRRGRQLRRRLGELWTRTAAATGSSASATTAGVPPRGASSRSTRTPQAIRGCPLSATDGSGNVRRGLASMQPGRRRRWRLRPALRLRRGLHDPRGRPGPPRQERGRDLAGPGEDAGPRRRATARSSGVFVIIDVSGVGPRSCTTTASGHVRSQRVDIGQRSQPDLQRDEPPQDRLHSTRPRRTTIPTPTATAR